MSPDDSHLRRACEYNILVSGPHLQVHHQSHCSRTILIASFRLAVALEVAETRRILKGWGLSETCSRYNFTNLTLQLLCFLFCHNVGPFLHLIIFSFPHVVLSSVFPLHT